MANPSDNERARLHRLAGAGSEFSATVIVCLLAGFFLDRWLDTKPVLLLIGLALGFSVGLYNMIRLTKQ